MAPSLVAITLSSEDVNFRYHPGIDPLGVVRAIGLNLRQGHFGYGGSTITQQLAKLLEPERAPRNLWTKLLEARNALRLELWLSKDEILEQYLNRAYYGRLAYGVEAAAQRFFGKHVSELRLSEAALLSVLPRAPVGYDPLRFPERVRARRAHVLNKLAERGWLSQQEADAAASEPIELRDLPQPELRHALDAVQGEARAELRLPTTFDLELSQRLQRRLRRHLSDIEQFEAGQAAIVVLDNASGDVLAMLGSRDYAEREANGAVNATLSLRPPGSTLKPFVYALAFEQGKNPGSAVLDVPSSWRDFQPRNVHGQHLGLLSARDALGSSLNVPAVRTAEQVGLGELSRLLSALQLSAAPDKLSQHGLALALGSAPMRLLDLTNAYATLARGGEYVPARLTHPERTVPPGARVLSAAAAYQVTSVLADAHARRRQFGVETLLEFDFPLAVKTGTSKGFCDNWAIGYTPDFSVGVWVGNFDGRPMQGLLAMRGAAPLLREAWLTLAEAHAQRPFAVPAEVEQVEVCAVSGLARGPHCPAGQREPVDRKRPPHVCDWHGPGGKSYRPAAWLAFRHESGEAAGDSSAPALRIESPRAAAHFAIDGLLPRVRQRLALRAAVQRHGVERVRWEVDGQSIAEVAAPFSSSWQIEPGKHRVRAVALPSGAQVAEDEVEIVVSGGT
ncbi:MAG: penicillin-binding protein 1C [Polyangiaceae bacterium]